MTGATGLDETVEFHIVNSLGWPGLRPLQAAAVEPVRSGDDCVLVAPTAGGKTEAAVFPLLSEMVEQRWAGTTVLYMTPLRALLNNLHPRMEAYGAWLGRTVGLWHGDVGAGDRRRILAERPDILLTTPESIEAMLVSERIDRERFFSSLRAVVIDELHSFASSDRGWHLLAVLERLERIAGRKLQRVGLSATVGNPTSVATRARWAGRCAGTTWLSSSNAASTTGDSPPRRGGCDRAERRPLDGGERVATRGGADEPVELGDHHLVPRAKSRGAASSSGRRASLPEGLVVKTRSQPAACITSAWASGCWSRVDTCA